MLGTLGRNTGDGVRGSYIGMSPGGTGFLGQTEASEDTAAEASSGQITFSDLKDYYVCMKSVKNRRLF